MWVHRPHTPKQFHCVENKNFALPLQWKINKSLFSFPSSLDILEEKGNKKIIKKSFSYYLSITYLSYPFFD